MPGAGRSRNAGTRASGSKESERTRTEPPERQTERRERKTKSDSGGSGRTARSDSGGSGRTAKSDASGRTAKSDSGDTSRTAKRTSGTTSPGKKSTSGTRRLTASDAAVQAALHVKTLTGREAEGVTSLEHGEEGWRVGIEVVETHRVPDSTDILAEYRVDVDEEGELLSYHRERRYYRSRPEES
ncbi:gas vesicle protein [Streptomyces sp. NPDC051776]|uniref:gas vesicle protein GvpO n=1 Tax=Streptomyces sp. NPDC051776 TaxID=3155414 RepID=UPI00341AED2A